MSVTANTLRFLLLSVSFVVGMYKHSAVSSLCLDYLFFCFENIWWFKPFSTISYSLCICCAVACYTTVSGNMGKWLEGLGTQKTCLTMPIFYVCMSMMSQARNLLCVTVYHICLLFIICTYIHQAFNFLFYLNRL